MRHPAGTRIFRRVNFHPVSYGYRPGRSAHQAISKAQTVQIRRYSVTG